MHACRPESGGDPMDVNEAVQQELAGFVAETSKHTHLGVHIDWPYAPAPVQERGRKPLLQ